MILQKLIEYQKRGESTPRMYQEIPIPWIIDLDSGGKFLNIVSSAIVDAKGKPRAKRFIAPAVMKSVNVKPNLLLGNGEYVLGIAREKSKPSRVAECHKSFKELVELCADKTKELSVGAVLKFLQSQPIHSIQLPVDFSPADNITFRVDGEMPIDLPAVREFWVDHTTVSGNAMQCILCGKIRPPERRIQFKIKNIPGGQTSGMAVISANNPAFESYGLEKSLIAPTCSECGELFSKGLNHLLNTEGRNLTVGPVKYIFWTKEETDFNIVSFFDDPDPAKVKALILSTFTGREGALNIEINPFYAAAVTASGGRVVFRDWIDTTVGNVKQNLAWFFQLSDIADPGNEPRRPLGIYRLSSATALDARKNLPAHIPKSLISFALRGGALPYWLMALAIERNRAENRVPRHRAALMKLVFLSNIKPEKEDYMVNLETENREPAYICGRLLAALESIQYNALGKVGANVVDRFYGTASSAPASVFGNLLKGAQAHLSKIRKEKPGLETNLQKELQSVLQVLPKFPKTLGMQGQALFALGYYHQRARHFAGKGEKVEGNENQLTLNSSGESK